VTNKRIILLGITAVVSLIYLYMTWIYAPPEENLGENIRIFFQHVAPALIAYGAFGVTLVCSIMYLYNGNLKYDLLGAASIKVGLLFTTITLLTGMIWANAAWGSPWNWDPRETTTLILWVAYAILLVYRSSIGDREAKAQYSSVLGIVAFPAVLLSYLSIYIWGTLHPVVITTEGLRMGFEHGMTLMVSMFAIVLIYVILLDLTYFIDSAEEKLMRIRMSRS
jgi:heme exporter protein C